MMEYSKKETLEVNQDDTMMQLYFNLLYVPVYDVTSSFITSYRNLWKSWMGKLNSKPRVTPNS